MKWISLFAIALISVGVGLMVKNIGASLAIFGVGSLFWVISICYFRDT